LTGTISQIQRFSTEDGTGIRTTVFFKGCPLKCPWCHNPETIANEPQILSSTAECIHCGNCVTACPESAHSMCGNVHIYDAGTCRNASECQQCVNVCPVGANRLCGRIVEAWEIADEILKDKRYYETSGGGVTLSGGEPLFQIAFCVELASLCYERGIPVLLDTSGAAKREHLEMVIPFLSDCFIDLKSPDPVAYRNIIGFPLEQIRANMEILANSGVNTTVRIPVIPGFNDDYVSAAGMAEIIKDSGLSRVNLLPFHRFGSAKYQELGYEYLYANVEPPKSERMLELQNVYRKHEIMVV